MFLLFAYLFATSDATEFGRDIEHTFDLTRCSTYFLDSPLFQMVGHTLIQKKDVMTLYLPKVCWPSSKYSHEIPDEQNFPNNPSLNCFVITNGSEGKKKFFDALTRGDLHTWNTISTVELQQQDTFKGYMNTDGETFALVGLYRELSSQPLIGSQFSTCGVGAIYIRNKERTLQDEEARQHWQKQFGPGSVVVVYPAGGFPYGGSQHASANFC